MQTAIFSSAQEASNFDRMPFPMPSMTRTDAKVHWMIAPKPQMFLILLVCFSILQTMQVDNSTKLWQIPYRSSFSETRSAKLPMYSVVTSLSSGRSSFGILSYRLISLSATGSLIPKNLSLMFWSAKGSSGSVGFSCLYQIIRTVNNMSLLSPF